MKLENTLTIPVPAREAWLVLLDIERIAPCVPGAVLTSSEGDSHHGTVKAKLGPVGLTYGGTVTFLSRDAETLTAVLEASGREKRGAGTAKAVVTCRLLDRGPSTEVVIETDLAITGRPAQFGRSTLSDVATALIDQFAANLAAELADDPGAAAAEEAPSAPEPAGVVTQPSAQPLDLLGAGGGRVAVRAGAALAAVAAFLLFLIGARRRRSNDSR
ncbi:SRPBCC family protein [Actinocorallia longicatena]|uniref:Carbon monoxide dehydrogenase subunit G n=1 Tax=Actinocorallia longicatena TaxID=111803 RepID=A0ABP6Q7H5_9ACTN